MIASTNTSGSIASGPSDVDAPPATLAELLSYAARHNPDGGVREGGELTTWPELDQAAGRLGATLQGVGVKAGDRVGVHFRKSIAGTVAMHAAVRIGAIAVPLDPGAPAGYLASVVHEVGISVLCTHPPCRRSTLSLIKTLGQQDGSLTTVVGLDGGTEADNSGSAPRWIDASEVTQADPVAPAKLAGDTPSYIITTSGSTGRPKGVVHTHDSAMAYVERVQSSMQLSAEDRIGDGAPHHFDVSALALWNTPYVGATAVILPEAYQMLPASLSELVEAEALTVWYSAPFTLRQLEMRGALDQRDLSSIRWALFGGEVYPPAALAALMAHLPNATLRNCYGPCETNVCSIFDLPGIPSSDAPIAIGHPWEDTRLRLVLDGEDVEDGEQGEIWIQSPTMMVGYWKRPELNATCFVDVATGPDAGRWYRSGDLGRRRPDGELVFDGRLDHQVKVRGHRIELEFVEAILEDCPAIDLAVVTVNRRADGTDTLIAGVMRQDGATPDLTLVRNHAADQLPAYGCPSEYHVLSTISETGSGKLDRRAIRSELNELNELNESEPHRSGPDQAEASPSAGTDDTTTRTISEGATGD